MKTAGLAFLIYFILIFLLAIIYKIAQCFSPEGFLVATPVINSTLLAMLYISFFRRKNKGNDLTKVMKPANDALLFSSAALVSLTTFSAEFSFYPLASTTYFLLMHPQFYLFIKLLLVTAAFVKAFIAIIEMAAEFNVARQQK